MKIKNSMLVVRDLEKSKAFYWEVLGLRTLADLGIHAVGMRDVVSSRSVSPLNIGFRLFVRTSDTTRKASDWDSESSLASRRTHSRDYMKKRPR